MASRLASAKEVGELERQSRQIDQSIIDLSGDLEAAKLIEQGKRQAWWPLIFLICHCRCYCSANCSGNSHSAPFKNFAST